MGRGAGSEGERKGFVTFLCVSSSSFSREKCLAILFFSILPLLFSLLHVYHERKVETRGRSDGRRSNNTKRWWEERKRERRGR